MPETQSALPEAIVESIAISNAKSIGEQPALLANLALANQVFNTNLQQLTAVSHQQAMNQILLAAVAKCISLIVAIDASPGNIAAIKELIEVIKAAQPNPSAPPKAAP